ncbi:hydrogen gas-evolving membrane-bound hydrogenase subunit E [Candidatus Solincola tengchongensis]|uniref:hydrogen gas-evolving membrane-bound hydrogenase subunit E n=1 Tax=Candidatus Solincola tengchongensis TaxID=2900693 RepID=UPI00257CCBF7|nr:hydrogen gas-evolving membrane-bound hydrogenase subunit E [Candidatus Solincola tengchongensis]
MKRVAALLFIAALAVLLLYVVSRMPPMGDPETPTATHVIPRYLEKAEEETHTVNVITGVILNYRGYDTMGEVTVIFCALAAVLAVLGRERRGVIHGFVDRSEVPSSTIVRTMVRFIVPFIILFSVYTILHGETSPGGGFQGGAIIGGSMIIFTTIFGLYESSRRIPLKVRAPLEGAAVMGFFLVGTLGLVGGGNFLTYAWPRVAQDLHPSLVVWLTVLVEVGIGLGGAMVLTSILFAMIREEEEIATVS